MLLTTFVPSLQRCRVPVWIACFTVMGVGCVAVATRRYLHCYITVPVFLLGAVATAIEAARIRRIAWQHILVGTFIATAIANTIERLVA